MGTEGFAFCVAHHRGRGAFRDGQGHEAAFVGFRTVAVSIPVGVADFCAVPVKT